MVICVYLMFMFFTFNHVISRHVNDLIKIKKKSNIDGNQPACCGDIDSCFMVDIVPELLGQKNVFLPGGIKVSFVGHVNGNVDSYHYASEQADLYLLFNQQKVGLHGHVMTSCGKSFVLEFCGSDGHVWKELNVENFKENDDEVKGNDTIIMPELQKDIEQDNTTVVTYSVKFYYTPEFAATTPDIEGFIDEVIMETNAGYENSKVPLKAAKHCIEEATIHDELNQTVILYKFMEMKSSIEELRGTADVAALLVNNTKHCGTGFIGTYKTGETLSVTRKDCAVGSFTFGHEVGHNFGLQHDPLRVFNENYTFAHGHLIEKGFRTILAVEHPNYETRVNYYSNPDVIFPLTGTATGEPCLSNNAALLIRNRFALAKLGDESLACGQTTTM